MADFTGMTVRVTMKPPSGMVLQGVVKEVVPGRVLTLQDVYFLHNGSRCMEFTIRGPNIADLQVIETNSTPYPSSAVTTTAPPLPMPNLPPLQPQVRHTTPITSPPVPSSAAPPRREPSNFVDPAILSFARSPAPTKTATIQPPAAPATPIKSMLAQAAAGLPANSSPFVGEARRGGSASYKEVSAKGTVAVPHIRQPSTPQVEGEEVDGAQELGQVGTKKKTRRSQKKKPAANALEPPPVIDVEVSRNGNDMDASVKRGKGWRQTPLLQPSPQTGSPQNHHETGRKAARKARESQQNGWATEDATDIQDMGDFDFEASHKLFDKQSVFFALRQGDTTADEDRLVSHNKLPPRPGTYGGKNLHPTENVLSPKLGPHDSSSDADTELNFPSGGDMGGRSSSRHSLSRVALKKGPSRQNSAQVAPHPLSASMSSDRGGLARSATSLSAKGPKTVPSVIASPLPSRVKSPVSATAPIAPSLPPLESHFALKPTMTPCPVLLPSALETLETETISRYGLTAEAITETAARSIAESAMGMFKIDSRRGSRANLTRTLTDQQQQLQPTQNHDPVVVIIAGNHTTGARALAAARHLLTRKTRLIIAEMLPSSPETQDPNFRTQLSILKRLVKSGANIKRGTWRRASTHIKNLPSPPAIIIDALLAGSTYDSLLDTSTISAQYALQTQQETREMIDWANRSRAPVLSVTCPSGVSGFDGSATVVEGEPLAIRPNRVLCLGAPMRGLLDAAKGGERWELGLADLGVNIALRREEAVVFGAAWMVEVVFVEGGGEVV